MNSATRIGVLIAVLALVTAACGMATQEGQGNSGEVIGLKGSWSVKVFNQDGSPAMSAEFHNDLHPSGGNFLADVLARNTTVGDWAVVLAGSPSDQPCELDGTMFPCQSVEPGGHFEADDNILFATLVVSSDSGVLTLAGSVIAGRDSAITEVRTSWLSCAPDVSPSDCAMAATPGTASAHLTTRDVTTLDWDGDGTPNDGPIPVSAGQTIQVRVDVSFGTLSAP